MSWLRGNSPYLPDGTPLYHRDWRKSIEIYQQLEGIMAKAEKRGKLERLVELDQAEVTQSKDYLMYRIKDTDQRYFLKR